MELLMQMDVGTRFQELGEDLSKVRRLFRRLGVEIDPQTQMTIQEACDRSGISFKDFQRTLSAMTPGSAAAQPGSWDEAPLTDLVRHIQETHHTYTRRQLIRLQQLLDEATCAQGDQLPELLQIQSHFQGLKDDLLKHLEVEDQVIFPSILAKSDKARMVEDLQRMVMKEHEAAEELFQNIGILTRNFSIPQSATPLVRSLYLGLRDLEEDLFMHIYLENHLLFPRSLQATP